MRVYAVKPQVKWFNEEYFARIHQTLLIEEDEGIVFDFVDKYMNLLVKGAVTNGDIMSLGNHNYFMACLESETVVDLEALENGLLELINFRISNSPNVVHVIIPNDIENKNQFEEKLIKIVHLTDFPFPIYVQKLETIEKQFRLHS